MIICSLTVKSLKTFEDYLLSSSKAREGEALLVPPKYKKWPARVVIVGQKDVEANWSIFKSFRVIHHDLFELLHSAWHGCNSVLGLKSFSAMFMSS